MRKNNRLGWARILLAGGSLFLLGNCGLSDQQLQAVWQSVITSTLTSSVDVLLTTVAQNATQTPLTPAAAAADTLSGTYQDPPRHPQAAAR